MLKVSAFYLEKQKSFIPKKIFFQPVVNIKTKKLCLPTQFSVKVLKQVTTQIINHHMTSSIQHAPAQPPFIPPWIKTRLDELGITEEMFEDLLKIYESVRDEYIDLTKKVL